MPDGVVRLRNTCRHASSWDNISIGRMSKTLIFSDFFQLRDRTGLKLLGVATDYAWKIPLVSWEHTEILLQNAGLNLPEAAASLSIMNGVDVLYLIFDGVELVTLVWLVCNFTADIPIAASMLYRQYSLHKARRYSLYKGTQTSISRLMANAVETGTVTAVAAGVELVLLFFSNYYQVM
ncbi:hypothetical protein BD779DRAFT_1473761 [Infundibulicybe gibba]|nr:hypothetical protein BD779DRAFT_1473761 [Infundibulicybe gibba]